MTPSALHAARVAEGRLKADGAQAAALPALDALRERLDAPMRGFFRRPEAPRGLYLWGGVGTGKSMLMDLFLETVDVPVRRQHFTRSCSGSRPRSRAPARPGRTTP
jgi:cell division protein ZapE